MVSARGRRCWAGLTWPTMVRRVCPWCSRQPAGTNIWRPTRLPTMIWHQSISLGLEGRRHLQLSFNLLHKPLYQRTKLKTELSSNASPQESDAVKTLVEAWENDRKRRKNKAQFHQRRQCRWGEHIWKCALFWLSFGLWAAVLHTVVVVCSYSVSATEEPLHQQPETVLENGRSAMVSHLSHTGLTDVLVT